MLVILLLEVSILDRPEGRSQHFLLPFPQTLFRCFNPRSPRRTIATQHTATATESKGNSFNPRSPRRTIATLIQQLLRLNILFQSSIAPKDDRNKVNLLDCKPIPLFQSSIAPKDDRNLSVYSKRSLIICFNPRSPRRTIATVMRIDDLQLTCVSILDRPEGRSQLVNLDLGLAQLPGFNPRSPRRTIATAYIVTSLIPRLPV